MKQEITKQFIKKTESLIDETMLPYISITSSYLSKMPLKWQRRLANKSENYMGFIVNPYATFLAYEIKDIDAVSKMIPYNYRLIETKIFAHDKPKYYIMFCAFNTTSSAFKGNRLEMYVIAEDTRTDKISWIIIDYDTNTTSYDPGRGFSPPNRETTVVATSYNGTFICNVKRTNRELTFTADITKGKSKHLDPNLWITGNVSIDYGKEHRGNLHKPFSLIFDPGEMRTALSIPPSAVEIDINTWHRELYATEPDHIICFPYAQHFITTSFPSDITINSIEDLENYVEQFSKKEDLVEMSTKMIKIITAAGLFGLLTLIILLAIF